MKNFFSLLCVFQLSVFSLQLFGSEAVAIAPGVWRIRLGTPEAATPANYRMFQPDLDGLKQLPDATSCPVNPTRIYASTTPRGVRLEMPYDGEVVYGLGLQVKHLQQQGKIRYLMNNAAELVDLGTSHASFPYYVSSKGYAVYVDTSRYTTLRIGTNQRKSHDLEKGKAAANIIAGSDDDSKGQTAEDMAADRSTKGKPFLIEIPAAQGVDIYVFAGPTMLDAVRRYNLYSGGGALPTLAGLAPKFRMESLASQQHVFDLIRHFRTQKIPFTTIALEPGWHTKSYPCTYNWNHERYNHVELLAEFKKLNYRLDLWEHPFIHHTSTYYKDFYDKSGDYAQFGGLVPDLADPAALALYTKIHSNLIDLGAQSFKIDANDNLFLKAERTHTFPNTAQFPSGLDGEQMHQLFGILTQQGVQRAFADRNLRSLGETRCSGPFAAPYTFVLFSDMGDHTDYYRMMLTGGFCGLLWQPEIRRASNNTFPEYYSRIQMAVLSPLLTFNNYMMPTPAWFQMNPSKNKAREHDSDETIRSRENIIRPLLEQRMAFIPYLYSSFKKYQLTGKPPFRALALDYPNDKKCANISDQMMIGDSILGYVFINPKQFGVTRKVYLPEGVWYDYNTGKRYEGGASYEMKFSATVIPAFVKDGSLLPLAKPLQYIDGKTVFEITARVYGNQPASFALYEDDGETLDYKKGDQTVLILNWNKAAGGSLSRAGNYKNERYKIVKWEQIHKNSPASASKQSDAFGGAPADLAKALEVLMKAGVLTETEAAYFAKNIVENKTVTGASMVPVLKAAAQKLGGPAGTAAEAAQSLREKKQMSPTNKTWDNADQPDDKPHGASSARVTLIKLSTILK